MTGQTGPVRTCIGCRAREAKSDLLRVVLVEGACRPDPRGRLPGRGAYIHSDLVCLDLAERRRAFPRALRVAGPLDLSGVRRYIEAQVTRSETAQANKQDRVTDERSMSTQR